MSTFYYNITRETIIGRENSHVISYNDKIFLHPEVKEAFIKLKNTAGNIGIDLAIISGFRSFKRQEVIWNEKMKGIRPILDSKGDQIRADKLTERERIRMILKWSACPGLSRHHFGTDLDVFDYKICKLNNYQLKLIPNEYIAGGIFENLTDFLDKAILEGRTKFTKPYREDLGGILPEPWHISFEPIAKKFIENFDIKTLITAIQNSDIIGKEILIDYFKSNLNLNFNKLSTDIRNSI